MRVRALVLGCAAACALALQAGRAGAAAAPSPLPSSALIVFAAADGRTLAHIDGMSVGIMSASQGNPTRSQLLLDISEGARISASAYASPAPRLTLARRGHGWGIAGWHAALRRAAAAPALLEPGVLAGEIPGGAAYAGIAGGGAPDAALAADRRGRLASVSLGTPAAVAARARTLLRDRRLVVADLPAGPRGLSELDEMVRERGPGELVLVIGLPRREREAELLWLGAAGLPGGGARELSSRSTTERGLAVDIDLTPTVLEHLGLPVPSTVRGAPLRAGGALAVGPLADLMARLRVISGRRLRALAWLLLAWTVVMLACARWPRARAWALRAGALGVMWAPVVALLPAALEPSAPVEYGLIALGCLAAGALTDALVPWPRAVLVPALVAVLAITTDALAGTQLLLRSLLGPDPILGARFYGVGNELKSGLAVLVLAGVAGSLYPASRGRRAALAMALAGVLLAVVEGAARIGAGVGGVLLVSFSFAVAAAMLLDGAVTRRRVLAVLLAPPIALIALAGVDLATAGGAGHFTGSVLHARSFADVRDLVVRRYEAAFRELHNHAIPLATAFALVWAAWGVRARARLLAPVGGDVAWLAALWGTLAAGLAGALVEDSGPLLFLVAIFTGGCACAYLWGRPLAVPRDPRLGDAVLARPVQHDLVL